MFVTRKYWAKAVTGLLLLRFLLLGFGFSTTGNIWGLQAVLAVSDLLVAPVYWLYQAFRQAVPVPLPWQVELPGGGLFEPLVLLLVLFCWSWGVLLRQISELTGTSAQATELEHFPVLSQEAPIPQPAPSGNIFACGESTQYKPQPSPQAHQATAFGMASGFGPVNVSQMNVSPVSSWLWHQALPSYYAACQQQAAWLSGNAFAGMNTTPQSASFPNCQGQIKPVTVLFADIRGYTALVEKYPPQWVIHQLNEFFSAMTQVILSCQGCVDKYMGDAVMAFFESGEGQMGASARNAVGAACAMLQALESLNQKWKSQGLPVLEIGIGINTGDVFIGNIGSSFKMDYTVIGDHVNLASRLEQMNKVYETRVILSEFTYTWVKDLVKARYLGNAPIRGKKETVKMYELVAALGGSQVDSAHKIAHTSNKAVFAR